MKKTTAAFLILLLSVSAYARGGVGGGRGGRGGTRGSASSRGSFGGRTLSRSIPRFTSGAARSSAIVGRRASVTGSRSSFSGGAVKAGGIYRASKRGVAPTSGGSSGSGGSGTDQAPPPNFSKPGALIRTEGQLPVYSDPGNARTTSVEGGGFVTLDPASSHSLGGAGVGYGRADRATSSGSGAGGNGVTSNGGSFDPSF